MQPKQAVVEETLLATVNGPVLILTSSLLTDRMIRFSTFLGRLTEQVDVVVWSTAMRSGQSESIGEVGEVGEACLGRAEVRPFPARVEFPHRVEMLRRLNDTTWTGLLNLPSRRDQVTSESRPRPPWAMQALAPVVRGLHGEVGLESFVGRRLVSSMSDSPIASEVSALGPCAVLSMNPMWSLEAASSAAAMSLGVPTLAFMTSFDNLSTKRRIELPFDRWLLWSDDQRRQLAEYYPWFPANNVRVVGAPQFDPFTDSSFHRPRSEWCSDLGLDPARPIVLHALGSPNFIREAPGAVELARRVSAGELGDVQLVVRPHPIHDGAEVRSLLARFAPDVVVQATSAPSTPTSERFQDRNAVVDWVNTFRHADVVVNLSSSVTVDACVAGRPVVSLDFDPHPDRHQDALVKSINRSWPHFAPIANSGGVWMARDYPELLTAVRTYLADPDLHAAERKWVAEFVCGYVDGRNGERLADAVLEGLNITSGQTAGAAL